MDDILKQHWVILAAFAGLIFGHGVVLTNMASRSEVTLTTTLFLFGVVWIVGSFPAISFSAVGELPLRTTAYILLAGALFFAGNFFQFTATISAPLSGLALLVITAVMFMVTFVYDAVRLVREGKTFISLPEAGGVALIACGLLVLVLCSKK